MSFVLTGFTHDRGFRVFAFDHIGTDRVRTQCIVRADLALIRHYGIQTRSCRCCAGTCLTAAPKGTKTCP